MSKIIAFANHKGGVSKTTSVANIGAILSQGGKKVLLIDLDAQANLTDYFLKERPEETIYDALVNETPLPVSQIGEKLYLVPSSLDMVGLETKIADNIDRAELLQILLEPIREEYDYILIDCSPSLGLITVNALTAADSVIIPVQCEYFALEGISKLLNTIKIIKTKLNPKLEIEGFLLTMYDSRLRLANQIYDEVKRHFQELVFKTVIQRNVKLSESPSHGLPVILYDADSTGSKNHLALAKEIISKN